MAEDIASIGYRADTAELSQASKELDKMSKAGRRTESAFEKSERRMERYRKDVEKLEAPLRKATKLIGGVAAGILSIAAAQQAIRAISSELGDFQATMSGVLAVTSATESQMDSLRATARQLGATTRYSGSQAAEGMRFLGMAGFNTNQIISAMPSTLDLATAGQLELGRAADIVSNALSAFNMQASRTNEVADILAGAASSANTNVEQLANALVPVGGIASTLNISLGDTAAVLASLAQRGRQGSEAGTAFRRIIQRLITPTKEAEQAILRMGLTVEELSPVTNDFTTIVGRLAEAGLDAQEAFEIFGLYGAPALLDLIGERESLEKFTESFANLDGRARAMAEIMGDNLPGDIKQLQSALGELIQIMGEAGMNDTLRNSIQLLTELVRFINENSEEIGKLAKITAAYLVIFKGLPLAYNLATAAIVRYRAAVISTALANELMTASTTKLGTALVWLRRVLKALLIVFAAWEIFKLVQNNFDKIQIATLELVATMMMAFERLKTGSQVIWLEIVKFAADQVIKMRNMVADLIDVYANATSFVPSLNIMGVDDELRQFGETLRSEGVAVDELGEQIDNLNKKVEDKVKLLGIARDAAIAQVKTEADLAKQEERVAKEIDDVLSALGGFTDEAGLAMRATMDFEEELERLRESGEKLSDEELAKMAIDFRRALEDMRAEMEGPLAQANLEFNRALDDAKKKLALGAIEADEYAKFVKLLATAHAEATAEIENQIPAYDQLINDLMLSRQEIGLNRDEIYMLNIARAAEQAIQEDGLDLTAQEIQARVDAAKAIAAQNIALEKSVAEAEQVAREQERIFTRMSDNVTQVFADFATGSIRSMDDLGDALKDIAKNTVNQIIAEFLRTRVVGGILSSMGGSGGGMGGLLSMFGEAGGGGAAAGASGGGGLMSGAGGALMSNPITAIVAAGMMINDGLFQSGYQADQSSSMQQEFNVATFAPVIPLGTTVLDRMLQSAGVGERIASLISGSSITAALFGHKRPEVESSQVNVGIGSDGVTGGGVANIIQEGGLFRSDKRYDEEFDLPEEFAEIGQEIMQTVQNAMQMVADNFNVDLPEMVSGNFTQEFDEDGELVKAFSEVMGRTFEESADQFAQRMQSENIIAVLESVISEPLAHIAENWRYDSAKLAEGAELLVNIVSDVNDGFELLDSVEDTVNIVEDLANVGETMTQTYQRLVVSTKMYEQALELSGVEVDKTREEFVRFADGIADAAGGLDRAKALWDNYFNVFFTASEKLEHAIGQASENANEAFGAIDLDVSDFTGEDGLQKFRELFNVILETGSEEAIVQWLEAANALTQLLNVQQEQTQFLENVREATRQANVELRHMGMSDLDIALEDLNKRFQELMQSGIDLGLSESELAEIREWLAANTELLMRRAAEAAMQAERELSSYIDQLAIEAGLLTETQFALRDLDRQYNEHIRRLDELAQESGRAGASTRELAIAQQWYQAQVEQIVAELMQQGTDLVSQLYGNDEQQRIQRTHNAMNSRYDAEMRQLEQLQQFIDNLMLQSFSPLTPVQRVDEARSQFEDALASGDISRIQSTAQTYLQELASFTGGVGEFPEEFQRVTDILQGLVDGGSDASQDVVNNGGWVEVVPSQEYRDLQRTEREALAMQLAEVMGGLVNATGDSLISVAERLGVDLADLMDDLGIDIQNITGESVEALAELSRVMGISLTDLTEGLGLELTDLGDGIRELADEIGINLEEMTESSVTALANLAHDLGLSLTEITTALGGDLTMLASGLTEMTDRLGIDLGNLTVQSTLALSTLATQLGADLSELATALGIDLGNLADSQSLLNQALEQQIIALPEHHRAQLEPLFDAITNATSEADANLAIQNLRDAVNILPPEFRDQLAPFFEGMESGEFQSMESLQEIANSRLEQINNTVWDIRQGILSMVDEMRDWGDDLVPPVGGNSLGALPQYEQGTNFVPETGPAVLHRGEIVIPASQASQMRTASSSESNEDLKEELRQIKRILKNWQQSNTNNQQIMIRNQQQQLTQMRIRPAGRKANV